MSDIHISRELLAARARGELGSDELLQITLQHLSRRCSHCEEEILAWQRQRPGRGHPQHLLQAITALLERESPESIAERRQRSRQLFRELAAELPGERDRRVHEAPEVFGSTHLAWILLEASRGQWERDLVEAENLAALAMTVLWYAPATDDHSRELLVRAHAYCATCCHRRGELSLADESFRAARHLVLRYGLSSPLLVAELDALEGALRQDQRRWPAAIILLDRAAVLYRLSRRRRHAARVLLQLATVYGDAFETRKAIQAARDALALLSEDRDGELVARGRHLLAWFLCDAGCYLEAERMALESARFEGAEGDRRAEARQLWLQGRIAAGRARPRDAERCLEIAQNTFLRRADPLVAAMVAADLALLHLQEGRPAEARAVMEALPALLVAGGATPDVLSSLLWVQRCARAGSMTRDILRRLQRLLRRALRSDKGRNMY
jgi:tetratricopeptide (TPR) repeat protein